MEYKIKHITEEIDTVILSQEEFDTVNKIYYDIMTQRQPKLVESGNIGNVKKCILTDGISRVELILIKADE